MKRGNLNFTQLSQDIKQWAKKFGFQQASIADLDLSQAEKNLREWIAKGFHGTMHYMEKHGTKRTRPAELIPGTVSVITLRMNYLPPDIKTLDLLAQSDKAYLARYSLGRDYHKLIRKRLQKLAKHIDQRIGPFAYRAFTDSAPVMEKPLAANAGLGWQGKNTLLLNKEAGSWFLLGSIYTDLPLPSDQKVGNHCGSCTSCIDVCPTQAIVAPYQLDARRCISYLTIEYKGSIPLELRLLMGNRVFGCDDCQIFCPWNKFAKPTDEVDFHPRHGLEDVSLVDLFGWTNEVFLKKTEGSAIRRVSYPCWLRNIAVALGNANRSESIVNALKKRQNSANELVREHVQWALEQHQ